MVRLSRIYTRTGDKGSTMLGDGSAVPKSALRVEAYGEVDEANATIGLAIACCEQSAHGLAGDIQSLLLNVQNELFDVGADLCVPRLEQGDKALRIAQPSIARLETEIDRFNEPLQPLNSFVLPGGTPLAAHLHLARATVRRAERVVARLLEAEPARTNELVMVYLNRLSDLLFVLARVANDGGKADVLWRPGGQEQT